MNAYLLKVEEDRVEPQEKEGDAGGEPVKRLVLESLEVDPDLVVLPRFGLAIDVLRVGRREEEREQGGSSDQACDSAHCVVETDRRSEETEHDRIDEAGCAELSVRSAKAPLQSCRNGVDS